MGSDAVCDSAMTMILSPIIEINDSAATGQSVRGLQHRQAFLQRFGAKPQGSVDTVPFQLDHFSLLSSSTASN